MMVKVRSGALRGVEGYLVDVEVDVSQGLPSFDIVGLPDSAVKESRERVRAALKNAGYDFPIKRITVNLAPADTKKIGPAYDFPIAIGILCCIEVLSVQTFHNAFITGELSLDGQVKPVSGVLPMVHCAAGEGITQAFLPADNAQEGALVTGMRVFGIRHIKDFVAHMSGKVLEATVANLERIYESREKPYLDFADVKGQESVKRALLISAAGMHNALMIGPPGSGKTMMAKRMPGILPNLTLEESLEITKIYSVSGILSNKNSLITERPFRSPHHTISYAALTGGGKIPKPGEISLAHHGVLFLDELTEFHKNVLDMMRQPLEDGYVTISRTGGSVTYPSRFMLLAAMNPCPCGHLGSGDRCRCSRGEVEKYLSRVSGPLLDRIDITVEAPAVQYKDLEANGGRETRRETITTKEMKNIVEMAQEVQKARFHGRHIQFNSEMGTGEVEIYCKLSGEGKEILSQAFQVMGLSARAYHKILKLARTIADIDGKEEIGPVHLGEAIQLRSMDRKYW